MTDFNNLQRSQAHVDQVRMGYDQQRYASERAMDQSIMQLPDLAMAGKKLESDLRAQEAAVQWQHQRNKLDTMMQVDMVQQSRLQTEAMAQANRAREFQLSRQQEQYEDQQKDVMSAVTQRLSDPRVLAAGYGPGEDGRMVKLSEEEREKRLKAMVRGGAADSPRLTAQYIKSLYTSPMGGFQADKMSDVHREWLQNAERGMYGYPQQQEARRLMGVDPGAALEDQGYGGAPKLPWGLGEGKSKQVVEGGPTLSPGALEQYARASQAASRDPFFLQLKDDMGDQGMQRLLAGVSVAADHLVASGKMPRDRAYQLVLNSIRNAGSEATPAVYFLKLSGEFDDERIAVWLRAKGHDQKTIDGILQRSKSWVDDVQKRRKK